MSMEQYFHIMWFILIMSVIYINHVMKVCCLSLSWEGSMSFIFIMSVVYINLVMEACRISKSWDEITVYLHREIGSLYCMYTYIMKWNRRLSLSWDWFDIRIKKIVSWNCWEMSWEIVYLYFYRKASIIKFISCMIHYMFL